ncbi:hypothetical protein D0863_09970 [Hortaea werneckii]|uniref:Ketoreductase (KR) domain-containing protein n=1 Tax=Hortaea werneckii TaxID=91943 RepID=A0A3M7DIP2_HORWE|nr:hypothetical protein D0863_09970 [Hortaea werneckii]
MASPAREVVLITGANTGLGFQIAKVLLRDYGDRFYVFLGCRDWTKGEAAVAELSQQGFTACEAVRLDVTDNDSIAFAAETIREKYGRLDVLHVNAGITPDKDLLPQGQPISEVIKTSMATNVAGAAQTAEEFLPVLKQADNPRLVFMSTGFGSLTRVSTFQSNEKWPAYSASKAALNMIMLWYWRRCPWMRVNACNPGFRSTALNNFAKGNAHGMTPGPLELGARNAVRLSLLEKDGESGTHTEWPDDEEKWQAVPW